MIILLSLQNTTNAAITFSGVSVPANATVRILREVAAGTNILVDDLQSTTILLNAASAAAAAGVTTIPTGLTVVAYAGKL